MGTTLVVPAHIAAKAAAHGKCGSCQYRHENGGDLECHFGPPHATVLLGPVPRNVVRAAPGMEVGLQVQTTFPLIRDDQWCGQWKARTDAVS